MAAPLFHAARPPLVASERPPVLVLLHGFGSHEGDLMGVAPMLDARLAIYALRAPLALDQGGYGWFPLGWNDEGVQIDEGDAARSRDVVISWIEALGSGPVLLGGFSQGAMMSLGVGLVRPDLVSGLVLLSGAVLPRFVSEGSPEALHGKPALVQHGVSDTVLPIHHGRAVRDVLTAQGADLQYTEYPMGHEVSMESLGEAHAWISSRVG